MDGGRAALTRFLSSIEFATCIPPIKGHTRGPDDGLLNPEDLYLST